MLSQNSISSHPSSRHTGRFVDGGSGWRRGFETYASSRSGRASSRKPSGTTVRLKKFPGDGGSNGTIAIDPGGRRIPLLLAFPCVVLVERVRLPESVREGERSFPRFSWVRRARVKFWVGHFCASRAGVSRWWGSRGTYCYDHSGALTPHPITDGLPLSASPSYLRIRPDLTERSLDHS